VGLGSKHKKCILHKRLKLQNPGYQNVQHVEHIHVYGNIGVLKLICENGRTIWDTSPTKTGNDYVPVLSEKQG